MTTPMPHGPTPREEYLRQAAEAAESTRRNVRVFVWALIGVPLAIGAIVLIAIVVGGIGADVSAQSEADAYATIEQVYQDVGYTPPSYTTVRSQVSGICQNLAEGMSHQAAAAAMAQGFGDLSPDQAVAIVAEAEKSVCSR